MLPGSDVFEADFHGLLAPPLWNLLGASMAPPVAEGLKALGRSKEPEEGGESNKKKIYIPDLGLNISHDINILPLTITAFFPRLTKNLDLGLECLLPFIIYFWRHIKKAISLVV